MDKEQAYAYPEAKRNKPTRCKIFFKECNSKVRVKRKKKLSNSKLSSADCHDRANTKVDQVRTLTKPKKETRPAKMTTWEIKLYQYTTHEIKHVPSTSNSDSLERKLNSRARCNARARGRSMTPNWSSQRHAYSKPTRVQPQTTEPLHSGQRPVNTSASWWREVKRRVKFQEACSRAEL